MKPLPYRLCDVFTDRALAGNALAVFTDAEGLDTHGMQQLAREMNLSESAFVFLPGSLVSCIRLRIFTPTQELPFAGHPTLGTAFVLAEERPELGNVIRLTTQRGVSTVELSPLGAGPRFGWMTQPLPVIRRYEAQERLLAALGVERATLPIELYDNGPHYVLVELDDPAALGRLRPDMGELAALGSIAVTVTARLAGDTGRWKTRVFAPGEGIPEDPATGAAAGPTALHLARHGRIAFGDTIVIEQGAEIGRPSTLHARVFGSAGRLERVEVGGHAVVIGRGEITLP
jgi:trans-2,3-dihydro-3-hydroxyanthranilate isomerase